MNKVPLTISGAEKLRAELQQLKAVERPNVIAAIAEARSYGDLSENAEYDAAKSAKPLLRGASRRLRASFRTHKSSIPNCWMPMGAAFLVQRLIWRTRILAIR